MADPASLALGIAQIFAPPFISPPIKKLFDGWLEERPSNAEWEKEIQHLASQMQTISKFLQDADNKQSQELSVHEWLRDLKEVFYKAEDILDEYATDVAIKKMDTAYEENTHPVTEPVHAKSEWRAKILNSMTFLNIYHLISQTLSSEFINQLYVVHKLQDLYRDITQRNDLPRFPDIAIEHSMNDFGY